MPHVEVDHGIGVPALVPITGLRKRRSKPAKQPRRDQMYARAGEPPVTSRRALAEQQRRWLSASAQPARIGCGWRDPSRMYW
jgi:hypothetical protein